LKQYDLPEKFSVKVPTSWIQIPKKVIEDYSRQSNRKLFSSTYGFQQGQNKWFSYPCLMIEVNRKGKVTIAELRKMTGKHEVFPKGTTKENISRVIDGLDLNTTVHDSSNNTLWTSFAVPTAYGVVRGLYVTQLTNEGMIRLSFFSHDRDYKQNARIFESIARSLKVDAANRYFPSY
jgi:hypothetical protein